MMSLKSSMKNMKVKIDSKEVELLNEEELQNAEKFLNDSMINGKNYDLLNKKYEKAARHFMTMLNFGQMCSEKIDINEI